MGQMVEATGLAPVRALRTDHVCPTQGVPWLNPLITE